MNQRLHTYEPTPSFSFTERGGGLYLCKQAILQDLNYNYDPVGNITRANNAMQITR